MAPLPRAGGGPRGVPRPPAAPRGAGGRPLPRADHPSGGARPRGGGGRADGAAAGRALRRLRGLAADPPVPVRGRRRPRRGRVQRVGAMTTCSLVVPVYNNEDSIGDLVAAIAELSRQLDGELEAVFVIDGSPDRSLQRLTEALPGAPFPARVFVLSRNFGSFAAIKAGLGCATGPYFAVMAADLQEPPELVLDFFRI